MEDNPIQTLFRNEKYNEAINLYEKNFYKEKSFGDDLYYALSLFHLEKHQQAAQVFKGLVERQPNFSNSFNLSINLVLSNEVEKGVAEFHSLATKFPEEFNADALFYKLHFTNALIDAKKIQLAKEHVLSLQTTFLRHENTDLHLLVTNNIPPFGDYLHLFKRFILILEKGEAGKHIEELAALVEKKENFDFLNSLYFDILDNKIPEVDMEKIQHPEKAAPKEYELPSYIFYGIKIIYWVVVSPILLIIIFVKFIILSFNLIKQNFTK